MGLSRELLKEISEAKKRLKKLKQADWQPDPVSAALVELSEEYQALEKKYQSIADATSDWESER